MKWLDLIALASSLVAPTFLLAQVSTHVPNAPSRSTPRQQRVMAPPIGTRAAVRLRPNTAEAGESRTAQPPMRMLPLLSGVGEDGKPRTIAPDDHTGHWLLLYRTEHCVPCDRLMNVLAASSSADLRSGVPYSIVVGGASSNAASEVRANYTTLNAATWLTDTNRSAFTALKLRGTPEVIAMDGNRIVWKVSGNLGDPQQVLRLTDSWIAGTAAADVAAKAKASSAAKASGASAKSASVKR